MTEFAVVVTALAAAFTAFVGYRSLRLQAQQRQHEQTLQLGQFEARAMQLCDAVGNLSNEFTSIRPFLLRSTTTAHLAALDGLTEEAAGLLRELLQIEALTTRTRRDFARRLESLEIRLGRVQRIIEGLERAHF